MLGYIVTTFGLPAFIGVLIWACLVVLVFCILIWLCRYLGAPGFVEKILVAIGVLIILGGLIEAFTGYGSGGTVIVR